ncbi:MAG TPA: maleylpyruvate isomerase N-terminal domain-containing protein [Microthrixaceae bacterium]|nr:maleylpyruvate isomerase N-terminal domain-containing protein [Microthrixaceae bacterium]
MSEIAERYRCHAADFTEKIAAVPVDRWHDRTPCEEWDALELVRHVIDSQGNFEGLVGREMPPLPPVEDDPLAACTAARDVIQADLDDPERADVEFDGFMGRSTFEGADDQTQLLAFLGREV